MNKLKNMASAAALTLVTPFAAQAHCDCWESDFTFKQRIGDFLVEGQKNSSLPRARRDCPANALEALEDRHNVSYVFEEVKKKEVRARRSQISADNYVGNKGGSGAQQRHVACKIYMNAGGSYGYTYDADPK